MKIWFFAFLSFLIVSFNAFSQSYLVLENGTTITIDKAGFAYDFGVYTSTNKVTIKGAQYLVEDAYVIMTVDEKGLAYRQYEMLPNQVKGKGMNYFIGDNGFLYTIDNFGVITIVETDPKMNNAAKFGGNFFIVNSDELYVVSDDGKYNAVTVPGLKPQDIISLGGTYFMSNRGVLHTISGNGKVTAFRDDRVGVIAKKGGNYFVDTTGTLYTISKDGTLSIPSIPVNLKVPNMLKLGSNYFLDQSGRLFTIDMNGNIFERSVNHDLKTAKIISL